MPDNSVTPVSNREVARRLSIAVDAANLGIWEWDLRTNEFVYSDRAKEIFGFQKNEPVTRERIIEVLHPGDHQIAKEQATRDLDPSLQKRNPYRYRIYRANDGELRWIHAFGEPEFETVKGKLVAIRFVGTIQDVTEEVLAKEELAQQEARLRLAIEASGAAVWELNISDQTLTHSPELNKLLGFPPEARPTLEELRSRYAPGERQRIEKEGAEARTHRETDYQTEIHYIWPDGTDKWLLLRAQLAPGETDYDGRVIGVLIDITEQKKREEQQALLVSEFQHRIKNSFAIVHAIVSQTLRDEDITAETRTKLLARLQAIGHAHDLIGMGAWESASLLAIIDRTSAAFDGERSGRIELQVDDVNLSPRAALSFSLVLHELFTNAVKYGALSNDDGRVCIKSEESKELLKLEWTEKNGPSVTQITRKGFGTRLIDGIFATEFDTVVRRQIIDRGLCLKLEIPIQRATASSKNQHQNTDDDQQANQKNETDRSADEL
jgi:PAS domain S-box-containing protein